MMTKLKWKKKRKKIKRFMKQELRVVAIGAAAFAGVSSFLTIGKPYLGKDVGNYNLLGAVITVMALRKIHNKTKRMKGSWLIKLSVAFGDGFLAIKDIMPSISSATTQIRNLWKNISKTM